jgi:glycerol kinase
VILVIDVGTTSLRAAVVDGDATIRALEQRAFPPDSPAPGLVEFDAAEMARLVLEASQSVIERAGPVDVVGITTQRASTVVWDRTTGAPVGPALGWQDLRTVGECIVADAEHGVSVAPNQTATKAAWLLGTVEGTDRDLCVGTVDSWIAWVLSDGELHVTDHTNATMTGLFDPLADRWDPERLRVFGIPATTLPRVVETSGTVGAATALPGAPAIAALVGDQQASMIGQGCVHPGDTKVTFGTGAMLDICGGQQRPEQLRRTEQGTFPIVAWSTGGELTWGIEAIMLSAGTNVDWLRDDLGLFERSEQSHDLAATCEHTDGVVYVPALLGLGTPHWDYGARGSLFGITRGTTSAHVVRAVLEGVAHRGADMCEAAEADTGLQIASLRIDGGMSQNPTFTQALADATGVPIEVSPVVEATTLGAAYLAGLVSGHWSGTHDIAESWTPRTVVHPGDPGRRSAHREQWSRAVGRTTGWIPELSALNF